MSELYDFHHEFFGIEDEVIFWYHPARNRKNRGENTNIKHDRATRTNLEVQEDVRIKDRCENKYGSE
jgi:hypothetical protein